jgi:hypothetical protein
MAVTVEKREIIKSILDKLKVNVSEKDRFDLEWHMDHMSLKFWKLFYSYFSKG